MFTQTFKSVLNLGSKYAVAGTLLAAGFILTGCQTPDLFPAKSAPELTRSVTLGNGVHIAGPSGFCIDQIQDTADQSAFVLLASCQAIAKSNNGRRPPLPVVLTVTVSASTTAPSIEENSGRLSAFFASENGRRSLSRVGDPKTVTVADITHENGRLFLWASDTSRDKLRRIDDTYGRAFGDVGGHVVTVTVLGIKGRAMEQGAGYAMLSNLLNQLNSQN